jgi:hypothetical protein
MANYRINLFHLLQFWKKYSYSELVFFVEVNTASALITFCYFYDKLYYIYHHFLHDILKNHIIIENGLENYYSIS